MLETWWGTTPSTLISQISNKEVDKSMCDVDRSIRTNNVGDNVILRSRLGLNAQSGNAILLWLC